MNDQLRELIQNVVESADDCGCEDDLTVASKSAIDALAGYLRNPPPVAARTLADRFPPDAPPDPIVVILDGGVVQTVENIPTGCVVHFHDYDVPEDYGDAELDENGERFQRLEWNG